MNKKETIELLQATKLIPQKEEDRVWNRAIELAIKLIEHPKVKLPPTDLTEYEITHKGETYTIQFPEEGGFPRIVGWRNR